MPARRGRPRKGDRRIDAAIDHFGVMGYAARDVSAAVADLLKVYGGPEAWPLLEEGSYQAVQDKLFEKEEEEEKQKLDQPLLLEDQQDQVDEDPPQDQEPAVDEAQPESMSILQLHDEVPAKTESAEVEDPMFIEQPPPLEAIVPPTAVIQTGRARRPCYGWISESEDEEQLDGEVEEEACFVGGSESSRCG